MLRFSPMGTFRLSITLTSWDFSDLETMQAENLDVKSNDAFFQGRNFTESAWFIILRVKP